MERIFCTALGILLFLSCTSPGFEKTDHGIIVRLEQENNAGVSIIRLDVVNEKIIHVSATGDNHFSDEESLIIKPGLTLSDRFTVKESADRIILSTDCLDVTIQRTTGEIAFMNKKGETLLRENKGGGKTLTPIEVEGTKGYTVHQLFESPDDEAFYGLGQHQADDFNYKGKNESLFQYNTKVSVPFVISNKNYGIVWDNYSLTKFGDVRDYADIDQFRLYGSDGAEGGLTAVYSTRNDSSTTIVRKENKLDYQYIPLLKNFPADVELNHAHVVWSGEMEAPESGLYRFFLHYAGYARVYLNNEPVVEERWRTAWNPNNYKFDYHFREGERVPLRIEWEPDGDVSYIALKALSPVSAEAQNKLSLWSEMGNGIDYYFVAGNSMDDVISGYRTLTGKSQIMPQWAMGFWQSRERYKTEDEIVETLAEFRKRKIPIDNIVQDWSYWPETEWGSHKFDRERFPDPKGMIDKIHDMHARIMISVWPKFYLNTDHYKEFDKNGWMYQQAVKDSIRDWIGEGYIGSFYDAYAEGARDLFWKQLNENLYSLGVDAWWMDASEPNIQDNTDIDYRKKLSGPTALGPSTKYLNAYSLVNAEAIYEGQRSVNPDDRVFLLTRSGFTGIQRYSTAVWSGDIGTRWEDMKAQISAGLNFALSGIPYWTMDIGGFCVEKRYEQAQYHYQATGLENDDLKEWRELNSRWTQFGAFVPLFRSHGQFPYREIFHIAPEEHPAYQSMLYYQKLRYRLMPYIYSMAGMTYFNDYTIMRALVMDFGKDPEVNDIGDQYMFGNALMVCPVYQYQATSREVYFPATTGWYDFYTGAFIEGGQQQRVDAPYSRIPLFVREGAIIPFGPEIQYTDEKKTDEIRLYLFAGKNGDFTLYEDEGVNYNYEKGAYATIAFHYEEASRTLEIGERNGSFDGMLQQRTFHVVYVDRNNPQGVNPDAKGIEVVYTGQAQKITLRK